MVFSKIKRLFGSKYIEDPKLKILNQGFGHYLSKQMGSSIDENMEVLPWFTYPAIEFLNQLDFSKSNFFEWGSGNSSKYFSKRCQSIISIEHNWNWYNQQKDSLRENQKIIFANESLYPSIIEDLLVQFDVIIIDGILRNECIERAVFHIADDGMIIYDNSERGPENCQILRNQGFTQIDFSGFGPINDYTWTTSIFFKRFKFKPISIQPIIPIGGGY